MTPTEQTFVDVVAREIWYRRTASFPIDPLAPEMYANRLLGMIEERNGASIEEIVRAAAEANEENRLKIPMPERALTTAYGVDLEHFFRAIARESLNQGKVFDEYAEFTLPYKALPGRTSYDNTFFVPRLNIEGAQS